MTVTGSPDIPPLTPRVTVRLYDGTTHQLQATGREFMLGFDEDATIIRALAPEIPGGAEQVERLIATVSRPGRGLVRDRPDCLGHGVASHEQPLTARIAYTAPAMPTNHRPDRHGPDASQPRAMVAERAARRGRARPLAPADADPRPHPRRRLRLPGPRPRRLRPDRLRAWTFPPASRRWRRHLAALDVPLPALHTIVATHCHPDHLGQASRLRARSGARVWLHALDAPLVSPDRPIGDADLGALVDWLTRYGFPPDEAEQAREAVDTGQGNTYLLEPDRLLEGGETFGVGPYRFEVVWTPGHAPGHVCLFESTRKLVLTGDHLFAKAAPNVRLMSYSPTGHDAPLRRLTGADRGACRPSGRCRPTASPFERVPQRAEQVDPPPARPPRAPPRLMTDRPQTAYELAQIVWGPGARTTWDTFHGRLRRNAALTLAAHLEQLALDGEIERQDDGVVGFKASRSTFQPT